MNTKTNKARVLIIDDDPDVIEDLRLFLSREGFNITTVSTWGSKMIKQARLLIRESYPHVIILDVNTEDSINDRKGLLLLPDIQSGYCIVYSGYLSPEITRDLQKFGVRGTWISKGEAVEILIDSVKQGAEAMCAAYRGLSVAWSSPLSSTKIMRAIFIDDAERPPAMPEDLLCQLFPNDSLLFLEPIGLSSHSSREVSRGRSVVALAKRNGVEPVVVKFGLAERLQKEQGNYKQFVRNKLGGLFYAQLEKVGRFWDLGAAVYNFIGSTSRVLPTFAEFYEQESEPATILRPLHHFFEIVWERHYCDSRLAASNDLFALYNYALHLEARFPQIQHLIENEFSDLFESHTEPLAWVLENQQQSRLPGVYTAVTHGDLHGDNLFVDGRHAWAIDFERTSNSHILRDFIELEIDIMLRLAAISPAIFMEFAQTVISTNFVTDQFASSDLLRSNEQASKALAVIRGIRQIAHNVAHLQEMRHYYWGLLFNALFVTTLPLEEKLNYQSAFILASKICDRLQQWSEPVPQEEKI